MQTSFYHWTEFIKLKIHKTTQNKQATMQIVPAPYNSIQMLNVSSLFQIHYKNFCDNVNKKAFCWLSQKLTLKHADWLEKD